MGVAAAAHATPAAITLFAIDVHAYPLQRHITLFLTRPVVRREPVLSPSTSPDAPDNAAVYVYGTVLQEGGLFRMWYYGLPFTTPEGGLGECPILYAESRDGLHWNRPNLGQVEWRGSRDNNLIALGDRNSPPESGRLVDASKIKGVTGLSLIRDDDEPRPERRYKMIYEQKGIGTAISPDGIHWTDLVRSHLPEGEPSGLYKYGGYYFVSCHLAGRGEGDREEGREAYAWMSTDFEHWQPETVPSFKTPEPMVGAGWGTDAKGRWLIPTGLGLYTQDHLGIAAIPVGGVLIGLYGMWNQRLPLWGEGGVSGDLGLVVSQCFLR